MEKGEEKRRFPRFNLSVNVLVSKRALLEKEKLLITKNISQGGACIIAYEELEEQDILDLKISLSKDEKPIKVTARVVWIREIVIGEGEKDRRYEVGVEFIGLDNEIMNKLNRYLAQSTA